MSTTSPTRSHLPPASLWVAASLFGLLLYAFLPAALTPGDRDEFGYIKSVIETLQHGRPWTDDYLEPWAASLSALSAGLFALTHSMPFALQSPQVVLGALAFAGCAALIRLRTGRTGLALVVAALVFTSPVLLRRLSEYSDFPLVLSGLFGCLWAAERRRWAMFFVIWSLVVASRQSALAWLVLPASAAWHRRSAAGETDVAWRAPAWVVVAGVIWFFAVARAMNLTEIQFDRTLRTLAEIRIRTLAPTLLDLGLVTLIALGLGALLTRATGGAAPSEKSEASRARWIAGALALAVLFVDPRALVAPDPRYAFLSGPAGWTYGKILVALAALGWLGSRFRLRGDLLLCAAAAGAAIAARQVVYDRYVVEFAVLVICAVAPSSVSAREASDRPRARWPLALLASAVFVFHLPFALRTKLDIDQLTASCLAHERALREKHLRPSELFDATAAFRGWYLHPYSVAHPLPGGRKAAGYVRFSEPQPTVHAWAEHPASLRRLLRLPAPVTSAAEAPLLACEFRAAWFWHSRYVIARRAPAAEPPVLGRDYRPVPFPLNQTEWLALVQSPSRQ